MNRIACIYKLLLLTILLIPGSYLALGQDSAGAPLGKYFDFDQAVPGEAVVVKHDERFIELQRKIMQTRLQNAEKFDTVYASHDAGLPYPYDEVLGLTEDEHEDYLAAWNKRRIQPIAPVRLRLEKGEGKRHRLHVEGNLRVVPGGLAMIRFNENTGKIETLNGTLERIDDVDTAKNSVLGEWSGVEWRGEQSDGLVTTTENLVVGQRDDQTFCYLIYRKREIESDGRPVFDQTLLVRFRPAVKGAGASKP